MMKEKTAGFEAAFEKWKEKDFGPYCMEKCGETCCDMRNVSLYITGEEVSRLFGKMSAEEMGAAGIKKANAAGMYYLDTNNYCPKFDSGTARCLDYKGRPKSCREFPFVVENDALIIKSGCPLDDKAPEYKKLVKIAAMSGRVIVKRPAK